MKIKHSKFRNTGLLYEFLINQIASDTISGEQSPGIRILRKYFKKSTSLAKEYKLYEYIINSKNIDVNKAERIISTVLEISSKINREQLKKEKYNLVSEIKKQYDSDKFFSKNISEYTTYAGIYCLLEASNSESLTDPAVLVENKTTVLNYLTKDTDTSNTRPNKLIGEFSKYDKDLKEMVYKVFINKFNKKYGNLTSEQKIILKEFIKTDNKSSTFKQFFNRSLKNIKKDLEHLVPKIQDNILEIKIKEVVKNIKTEDNSKPVNEEEVQLIMKYFELIKELKQL